jgi:hypothetical protein
MNSNLFHNIANVVMIVLAGVSAMMMAIGCTTLPTGALECSQATLVDPKWLAVAVTVIGVLKMLVNVVRDGIGGLAKPQPPVSK